MQRIYWLRLTSKKAEDYRAFVRWNVDTSEHDEDYFTEMDLNMVIAEILVFDWTTKEGIYKGELLARDLNTSMDFNKAFFEKLELCFKKRPKDVNFVFEADSGDPDDDLLGLEQTGRVLKVVHCMAQPQGRPAIKITWMSCHLPYEHDVILDRLYDLACFSLSFYNNEKDTLIKKVEKALNDKLDLLASFEKAKKMFEEDKLAIMKYSTQLINSKKEKLRELQKKLSKWFSKGGPSQTQYNTQGLDYDDYGDGDDDDVSIGLSCFSNLSGMTDRTHVSQLEYTQAAAYRERIEMTRTAKSKKKYATATQKKKTGIGFQNTGKMEEEEAMYRTSSLDKGLIKLKGGVGRRGVGRQLSVIEASDMKENRDPSKKVSVKGHKKATKKTKKAGRRGGRKKSQYLYSESSDEDYYDLDEKCYDDTEFSLMKHREDQELKEKAMNQQNNVKKGSQGAGKGIGFKTFREKEDEKKTSKVNQLVEMRRKRRRYRNNQSITDQLN